jgi:hypothetical protein
MSTGLQEAGKGLGRGRGRECQVVVSFVEHAGDDGVVDGGHDEHLVVCLREGY